MIFFFLFFDIEYDGNLTFLRDPTKFFDVIFSPEERLDGWLCVFYKAHDLAELG